MIRKLFPIFPAALAMLLSNCGLNSNLTILPKGSLISGSGFSASASFPTEAPSASTMAAAASHRKDSHGMPVYAFSERVRVVRTTAYTASEPDHLIYGSQNATGTQLRYSDRVRSAAADWSFYPVGTVFRVKGLPYMYVVDDYGSALTGTGTIDIYKPTQDLMHVWGTRNVEISVLQWGSFQRSAQLLGQRTSYNHCRQMYGNILRQRPDLATASRSATAG
jgi:3D (Asp-Asp-Asp) domain-containing protein